MGAGSSLGLGTRGHEDSPRVTGQDLVAKDGPNTPTRNRVDQGTPGTTGGQHQPWALAPSWGWEQAKARTECCPIDGTGLVAFHGRTGQGSDRAGDQCPTVWLRQGLRAQGG